MHQLFIIATLTVSVAAADHAADLTALLSGVQHIAKTGAPGSVCTIGADAFPVVLAKISDSASAPLVAAARFGKGRVVAFGHNGLLNPEAGADNGRLLLNAVRWVTPTLASNGAHARVAVHKQVALLAHLKSKGIAADVLDGEGWQKRLHSFHALCVDSHALRNDDEITAVKKFLSDGGGLVTAGLGWGWLQLNPGTSMWTEFPGNRLLANAGIVWADNTISAIRDPNGKDSPATMELADAARALDALNAASAGKRQLGEADVAQATATVQLAARSVPRDDKLLLPKLATMQSTQATREVPTAKKPITSKNWQARLQITLQLLAAQAVPPDKLRAHAASAEFPGSLPPNTPRVVRMVAVDTGVPAWHSTGLYAAPGEAIHVSVPVTAVGKKLHVRIGAHTDKLWDKDKWSRCPEITNQQLITQPETVAANAFGGPIYIVVPDDCKLGAITVKIAGAVEAPHFILGKTTADAWRANRMAPAPWAELETRKVILTVPSKVVRTFNDPDAVMQFWDRVVDAEDDLAGVAAKRKRPERYVTDVQIGAGYMHSGYPIMTHLDVAEKMVRIPHLAAKREESGWGFWHEMGHNHQVGDWTFDGTTEVTCNIFSLYICEKVCGMPSTAGHGAMAPDKVERNTSEHLAAGAPFSKWKSEPFLALIMYHQLQEAFGWDAYKKVFAEYRDLPRDQRPKTDDEKRNQWMVRFSRTVGKNLGPFFQAWGVPTSESARDSIKSLSSWMPKGFPPKQN